MKWRNKRFQIYRTWARWVLRSPPVSTPPTLVGGVWFHAASAGELEALIPVMDALASRVSRVHVSVFSRSGEAGVQKLRERFKSRPGWTIDFSPREGQWLEALSRTRPTSIVSYKYEAWPDLWGSASVLDIPIQMIGAQDRPSLRWVCRLMRALGLPNPRLKLGVFDQDLIEALQFRFKKAQCVLLPNPRWSRASERVLGPPSLRAQELKEQLKSLPSPRLFVSQIWMSDFKVINLVGPWKGSLILAPHSLDEEILNALSSRLSSAGYSVQWSRPERRASREGIRPAWVLNEMGVLPELYSVMDAVYIGGGFEKGVHSTIEPAVAGLPIACGPYRSERFEEVRQLEREGQLQVLRSARDWADWCKKVNPTSQESRTQRESLRAHWQEVQVRQVTQTDWAEFILC